MLWQLGLGEHVQARTDERHTAEGTRPPEDDRRHGSEEADGMFMTETVRRRWSRKSPLSSAVCYELVEASRRECQPERMKRAEGIAARLNAMCQTLQRRRQSALGRSGDEPHGVAPDRPVDDE